MDLVDQVVAFKGDSLSNKDICRAVGIREAVFRKNSQWAVAVWLLERECPDEYPQTARDRGERTEVALQIVLGFSVGVVKAEPNDEGASEGDGAGGDADG